MNTKDKIMQTAFMVFLDKGFKSTTYAELISATQVSKGAFYHYFKNKEELFTEVIDRYFLSFFNQVNWEELEQLELEELESRMQDFYLHFVNQIQALTNKGLSRYFILFFEALELHPTFREEAQRFYSQMKGLLERNATHGKSSEAMDLIARYEGYLFWMAVFPEVKMDELLKRDN